MENKIDTVNPSGNLIALLLKHPTAIYDLKINKTYFDKYIDKDNKVPNQNRAIFAMMEHLAQTRDMDKLAFDPMTIGTLAYNDEAIRTVLNRVFKEKSKLIEYLKSLKEFEVDVLNLDIYESSLIKSKITNDLLLKNEETIKEVVVNYEKYTAEEILNKVEESTLSVSNDFVDKDSQPEHIHDNFEEEYLNREPVTKGFKGMSSGFSSLDKFTGGILRPGGLTSINALSGVGKSILLKQIVKHVGIDLGKPLLWIGTEQTKEEQKDRLISEITGLDIKIIENGLYNMKEEFDGAIVSDRYIGIKMNPKMLKKKIIEAKKIFKESKIYIEKMESCTPEALVRRAKFFKKRHGIEFLVHDYIDDSYGRKDEELRHFLTRMATFIKQEISDRLNIAVLTATQASDFEWWHTRESKGIEKKLTGLICLRELTPKEQSNNPLGGTHGLVVVKNRNGKKHMDKENEWIPLDFKTDTLEFKEC